MKTRPLGSQLFHSDGHTERTKLIRFQILRTHIKWTKKKLMKFPSCLYVGFEVGIYTSKDKTASTDNFCNTVSIAIRGLCSSLRKIVPVNVRKEYREVMVYFHLFSTPALHRGERSAPLFTTLPSVQTRWYSLKRRLGVPHRPSGFPAEEKLRKSNTGPFTT
jgi:hypothetical protein